VEAYSDKTIDFPGLVKTLLHAPYRWILSEYENPVYRPLGEPIRIPTFKGSGAPAVECLWANFEPNYLNERTTMPKIDTAKLLAAMEQERDEIDAAIKTLNRTLQRNFAPPSGTTKRTAKKTVKSASKAAPKKKGRKYTKAGKKAMSLKLKASWVKRKAEGRQKQNGRSKKRKDEGGEAAAMAAKA
jgi:hypothetical protein